MQILTASPRDHLTDAQVRTLLTGPSVTVKAGLDLLDSSNNFVSDISADFDGGEVSRNCHADVHGTCTLKISQLLAWGKDRVRPWMELSDNGVIARFNLGVFVMTTPDSPRGKSLVSYTVTGYDLLHLLQDGPGDTYVVTSGTTYLQAVRDVLTASGVGATLQLDGTLQNTTLPATMVWALDPSSATSWLRIVNDLLGAIDYRGLWADQDGALRSGPYAAPSTRGIEWVFNTTDEATNLVGEDRSLSSDVWGARNQWKFVRRGMTTLPIEGNGIYTVNNVSTGRTSQDALGRIVRAPVQYLDAADQASLVSQGNRIIAADQARSRQFDITAGPLPIAGHFDIVEFDDANETDKCQVTSWTIPLGGSNGSWHLESVDA